MVAMEGYVRSSLLFQVVVVCLLYNTDKGVLHQDSILPIEQLQHLCERELKKVLADECYMPGMPDISDMPRSYLYS